MQEETRKEKLSMEQESLQCWGRLGSLEAFMICTRLIEPKLWTDVVNCWKGQEKSIQDFWILPIGLSAIKSNKPTFIFFTFISFKLVRFNFFNFPCQEGFLKKPFVIRLNCNKSSNFFNWTQFVDFIPSNGQRVNLRLIFVLRMRDKVAMAYNSQQLSSFDLSRKIQNFVVLDIQNI